MNTASARLKALLAGGAALAAFGLTAPVMADGANDPCSGAGHSYCPTNVGAPSGNGNGNGKAVGKPAAGTVGNADSKNPPGQAPDGSDSNNGYECDGNSGIGKTNPAHTGCSDPDPYDPNN
ncbi:MAG: hypothetical protein AVDCRST_MAG47-2584 [uncultured Nocardioidaceae bacterium]|uniref:Uncharacterized protein n=1 Tax=uncultured Nocardioidaceae bacterium TaxID=253824 RepID=A0A6J4NL34_9ACTN|nr:MAG: hypothetical protein AVDCRST_MAG47-2584 [uncultured Nocardioidaceae bacterium]